MNDIKKINTLQGLRFIAFLGVFLLHLNYTGYKTLNFASISVSFFFMLSGFFAMYTIKYNSNKNIFLQSFAYTKQKMSKFYKLYIFSILLLLPFFIYYFTETKSINLQMYIVMIVLSLLLLQSWVLNTTYILCVGGAGWYLSSLAFLNLLTYLFYKIINKISNKKVITDIILILLNILFLYIYSTIIPKDNNKYFYYYFPIFRIFEYFIGMVLCNIYKKKNNKLAITMNISTIIEVIVVIIVTTLSIISLKMPTGLEKSIICLTISLLLILTFSFEKGYISRILKTKLLVILGNISTEMYLLHYAVIVYIYNIYRKVVPINKLSIIMCSLLILLVTIFVSYIIHYKKESIKKKIKDKIIRFIGNFKKKKFKFTDFTIISNNCFAGIVYRNNNIQYQSPTCGLFIMPNDYIKFIYNLKKYFEMELKQISVNDSKYKEYLEKIDYNGTIGKLGDIEIMFLHYKDFEIAKKKWYNRIGRVNYKKIIYKFSDQNGCSYQNLLDFENFKANNKICFTAKKYDKISSIIFTEFARDGYVVNDAKEKIFKKYINIYDYINSIK